MDYNCCDELIIMLGQSGAERHRPLSPENTDYQIRTRSRRRSDVAQRSLHDLCAIVCSLTRFWFTVSQSITKLDLISINKPTDFFYKLYKDRGQAGWWPAESLSLDSLRYRINRAYMTGNVPKYRIPNSLVKPSLAVDFQIYCPRSAPSVHCLWFISLTGEFCRNIQSLKVQLRAHLVLHLVPRPGVMLLNHVWARRNGLLCFFNCIQTLTSFQITLITFSFICKNVLAERSKTRKKADLSLLTRLNCWVTWAAWRALFQLLWLIWLLPLSASVTDLILCSRSCCTHWRTKVCLFSARVVHSPEGNLSQGVIINTQVSVGCMSWRGKHSSANY